MSEEKDLSKMSEVLIVTYPGDMQMRLRVTPVYLAKSNRNKGQTGASLQSGGNSKQIQFAGELIDHDFCRIMPFHILFTDEMKLLKSAIIGKSIIKRMAIFSFVYFKVNLF
ncbi:MAG: hypothetical protein IPH88_18085 [Bacteroidales bacterium]|nr:hypothetical protein [Bacteroidales bacterium]